MGRICRFVLPPLLGLISSACDSWGPTDVDEDDPISIVRVIKEDPSFRSDIQSIFNTRGCASGACHGVGASAGLVLEEGLAHAFLVNEDATTEPFLRVDPGNANESYLIIKVEGRQTVGNRMPPSGQPLDNIDLTNLKNWINQGAKNN